MRRLCNAPPILGVGAAMEGSNVPIKTNRPESSVQSKGSEIGKTNAHLGNFSLFPIEADPSKRKTSESQHPGATTHAVHFYRLPRVLEILQISRAKFLKMVQSGQAPPPIKMSRCSLYIAAEIDKFAFALVDSSRSKRPFDIDALVSKIENKNSGVKK